MADPESSGDVAAVARTRREQTTIDRLRCLGETWPETLTLFSWSGSLVVLRTEDYHAGPDAQRAAMMADRIEYIQGILNDGGDP